MSTALDDMLATCVSDQDNTQNLCDFAHYYQTNSNSVLAAAIADKTTMDDVLILLAEVVSRLNAMVD